MVKGKKKRKPTKKFDIGAAIIGIIAAYLLVTGHYPDGTPTNIGYIFKIFLTSLFAISIIGIVTASIMRLTSWENIKKYIKK